MGKDKDATTDDKKSKGKRKKPAATSKEKKEKKENISFLASSYLLQFLLVLRHYESFFDLDLPESLVKRVETAEFVFFYGIETTFSQFHPAKFTVDGISYNCMEQYMHHQKAVVFKDEKIAKEIMATSDPLTQKKLGRKVSNFDKEVWKIKSIEVVTKGNIQKYKQNPKMLKELLSTYPKTIVEASPRDRLWGIGLSAQNPKAKDRTKWRGKNLLGKCLTDVREQLMKEKKREKGEKDEVAEDSD